MKIKNAKKNARREFAKSVLICDNCGYPKDYVSLSVGGVKVYVCPFRNAVRKIGRISEFTGRPEYADIISIVNEDISDTFLRIWSDEDRERTAKQRAEMSYEDDNKECNCDGCRGKIDGFGREWYQ